MKTMNMRHHVFDDDVIRTPWSEDEGPLIQNTCFILFAGGANQRITVALLMAGVDYTNDLHKDFYWKRIIKELQFHNWFVYQAVQR